MIRVAPTMGHMTHVTSVMATDLFKMFFKFVVFVELLFFNRKAWKSKNVGEKTTCFQMLASLVYAYQFD